LPATRQQLTKWLTAWLTIWLSVCNGPLETDYQVPFCITGMLTISVTLTMINSQYMQCLDREALSY